MTATVTEDTIFENIKQHVKDSPLRITSLSVLAGIPYSTLQRKLASSQCTLTVAEVASIARALGLKMEAFFEPVDKERDLRRSTAPGQPAAEELQGVGL